MPGITYIKRFTGALINLIQINTSDSTASAISANYLTKQIANIYNINDGTFQWLAGDVVLLEASDGVSWCNVDNPATTLTAFAGFGVAGVTYSGALVSGDIPKFSGTSGGIIDSGIVASNVVVKNAVNQMAAAGEILLDKGTGTISTGAVTINKQAGVITGTFTTAAAGTTSVTFNNSEIVSTSVILVSLMGGTNAIPGVQLSCAYTSAGVATLVVTNNNVAGSALSGTLIIGFVVL